MTNEEIKEALKRQREQEHASRVCRDSAEGASRQVASALQNAFASALREIKGLSYRVTDASSVMASAEVYGGLFSVTVRFKPTIEDAFETGVRVAAAINAGKRLSEIPPLPDLRTAVDLNREYEAAHPGKAAEEKPSPAQGELL